MSRRKERKSGGDGADFNVDPFAVLSAEGLPDGPEDPEPQTPSAPTIAGPVKLRLERKGRRGKSVTVLDDLEGPPEAVDELARDLRQHLGVGGTVTETGIELQGDCRERVAARLRADGYTVKGA